MITIKEHEDKHFSFKLEVKGADLSKTNARIIFEGKNNNSFFPVMINEHGICEHSVEYKDINSLKEGKVYLEVVADNVYFRPWEDTYKIETPKILNINLTESNVKSTSNTVPMFESLKKEYRSLMKRHGVLFLNGDSKENLEIKNIVISLLENKYGSLIKNDLPQLKSLTIDELIIL
jgi:hypothetical protein